MRNKPFTISINARIVLLVFGNIKKKLLNISKVINEYNYYINRVDRNN